MYFLAEFVAKVHCLLWFPNISELGEQRFFNATWNGLGKKRVLAVPLLCFRGSEVAGGHRLSRQWQLSTSICLKATLG